MASVQVWIPTHIHRSTTTTEKIRCQRCGKSCIEKFRLRGDDTIVKRMIHDDSLTFCEIEVFRYRGGEKY